MLLKAGYEAGFTKNFKYRFANGETGSNENQDISNFEKDIAIIQECLGTTWTAQTNTTHSGGKHTTYSTADKTTIISIRYFQDLRSRSKPWQNTISIGDKNN